MADGELLSLRAALSGFAKATETQSQSHIKPLHRHLAARLVIEGYDLRYVYGAPALASSTRRLEWSTSPALDEICAATDLSARLAAN